MFVSIIIPMRNEEMFIGRCLDSLLPQIQGRDNFEILCVIFSAVGKAESNLGIFNNKQPRNLYGDGHSAEKIIAVLVSNLKKRQKSDLEG